MSEPEAHVNLDYRTIVEQWWRASTTSPISGEELVAYGETVEDARRAVDLMLMHEAHERGLRIERSYGPNMVAP
jgi:hypothetical protein